MKPLILIADDDAKIRKLCEDLLQAEGYATLTAENGARAMELVQTARPSLIIMDIHMPVLDGLAAVMALKANPATQPIPVIALTALAMRADRDRILAAGFDDYLSKPFSIKTLRAKVSRRLGEQTGAAAGSTEGAGQHG